MRTVLQPVFTLGAIVLFTAGCSSAADPPGTASSASCKVRTESTTLVGNAATYEFTYGPEGNPSKIDKYVGGVARVLKSTTSVAANTVVERRSPNDPQTSMDLEMRFENGGIFDGFPTKAELAVTERGVTKTNQRAFFFFYGDKGQVTKVGQQTDLVSGDNEFDLIVAYDDRGNVTSLTYELTTGARTKTVIVASGYDDKPNPFARITNWYRLMHAPWDNYDPEPIFTALSKNNLLGFVMPDGLRRETTYAYNEHGYPIRRSHTNKGSSSSASFEESFDYDCQ